MYDWLHILVLLTSVGVAPAVLLMCWTYQKQYRDITLQWRKPSLVVATLVVFVINLMLLVLGCFLFAGYLGQIQGLGLVHLSPDHMRLLALDCMLGMGALTVLYLATQIVLTQRVGHGGIHQQRYPWSRETVRERMLRWDQIKDYYVKSDYPITHYYFLVQQPDGSYEKKRLRVPFYALPRFEALLEMNLQRQQELRDLSRAQLRKLSRN